MSALILAFVEALPGLVRIMEKAGPELAKIIHGIPVWINHVSGNDVQGYVKTVGEAMGNLSQAKSAEERKNAAKKISAAISGL